MDDTSSIPVACRHGERALVDEREERAWRSLQFMQMRLEGELARQLAGSGLSHPDYLVLVALEVIGGAADVVVAGLDAPGDNPPNGG
jgi:hypothetical protein